MPDAPIAPKRPHHMEIHGDERVDPWYWLRDDDREDPEILEYLHAENAYTDEVLAPVDGLKDALFAEMRGRIKEDDASVPQVRDGVWRYQRFEEGREYAIHCRRIGTMDAPEEVVLDENERAEGHAFYALGGLGISRDRSTMAFAEDTLSRRIYDIRFRNLDTGEDYDDVIEGTSGAAVWANDHRTLFYVRQDATTLRPFQVWRHELGENPADDVLVFEETDEEFYVSVWSTRSRDFIVIGSFQTETSELRTIAADQPTTAPQVFLDRSVGHEYAIDHFDGRFFIRSNHEAPNHRVAVTNSRTITSMEATDDLVAPSDDVFVEDFALFDRALVVEERRDAVLGVRVIPWDDTEESYRVGFDEDVYTAGIGTIGDPDGDRVRLGYTSLTTPMRVFDFAFSDRSLTLLKEQPVLGSFERDDYVAERILVTARDGVSVPVSIVHRRDLDRSVPQPVHLYAYGSYGITMDPSFSSARLSLLDRGFIFAVAHIRGGQEYGRRWYDDGKLLNKRNTFTDFIDVGQHLVDSGVTSTPQLIASGGSAGGLLMGAVANMRPDLFGGIVANVAFVDVVTTMLDESIPLTTFEYDEWGNPNDQQFYEYMLSYSPYDNIKAVDYPPLFALAGLHDSQVQYWEPAKWVAKLRDTKVGDSPLLLRMNMDAGHGGASGRFARLEEVALEYAFMLGVVNGEL
ncbi:MAG: S9 family peptidase [Actinomycetota bacterium]